MSLSNEEREFKDIEVLFKNRDQKKIYEQLENSRRKSVVNHREKVQRKGKIKINSIKTVIINISLCAVILVGGYKIVSSVNSNLDNPTNMNNLSRTIGTLVDDDYDKESLVFNSERSILSQNTYRIQDGCAYNHEAIARDLIALNDRELYEYAFYSLCHDMGENLNNVISGSKTNIDLVIRELKRISSYGNSDLEQYISNKLENLNTLDEYLISDNYVDDKGNPDLEKAIQVMNLKAEGILNQIERNGENKKRG